MNAVTFSSYPGTYVLTGSTDRAIHLSRAIPNNNNAAAAETTSPIQKYEAHGYSVLDIAVAADNSRFASVGGDRQVFLWDVEQGGTIRRWSGHNARVEAVQFAGEDDSVVVSGKFVLIYMHALVMITDGFCVRFRQCRHNYQHLGYQVQLLQANSDPHRSPRYCFFLARTYAHVLYRKRELRWSSPSVRYPNGAHPC